MTRTEAIIEAAKLNANSRFVGQGEPWFIDYTFDRDNPEDGYSVTTVRHKREEALSR